MTASDHGFRDVDGKWCFAVEVLNDNHRNYGRKRVGTRESRDGEDTLAAPPKWYDLGEHAERIDFLCAGGWHTRKAGTTGTPRGRPKTGSVLPQTIKAVDQRLNVLIAENVDLYRRVLSDALIAATRRRGKAGSSGTFLAGDLLDLLRDLCIAYLLESGVNSEALAQYLGHDPSTIRRRRRLGATAWAPLLDRFRTDPPANSPNRGGKDHMNPAVANRIIERLDRIGGIADIKLHQRMEGEQRDYERGLVDVESFDGGTYPVRLDFARLDFAAPSGQRFVREEPA